THQIIQPMPRSNRQRLEPPPIPLPHPTRSRGDLPIDHRRHRRQALLVSVEKGNDTLHEIGGGDVGHGWLSWQVERGDVLAMEEEKRGWVNSGAITRLGAASWDCRAPARQRDSRAH